MPNLMAIVSKAAFEQLLKQKPGAGPGTPIGLDRYTSTHKALSPLAGGGALFLVTVRPPDEALWLVGLLESPELRDDGWHARPSAVPIVDVSALRPRLRFANGKGLQAKPGALAMSLQTPRALSDEDAALLREAAGASPAPAVAARKPAPVVVAAPAPAPARAAEPPGPLATKPGPGDLEAAFASRDGARALLAALEAWRASRSPGLADLVEAVSARVSAPPLTEDVAWSAAAATRDPLVLGRLLGGIPSLAASFLPSAADLLQEFPDDPRIARAVAQWALEPPTTSSSTYPFWTRLLEVTARTGDARTVKTLRRRLAMPAGQSQFWPKFYAALEKAIAKIEKRDGGDDGVDGVGRLMAAVPSLSKLPEKTAARVTAPKEDVPVPRLSGPPLSQAAQHFAAGRVLPGLEALLAHWRDSRVPDVADLVDRATRLLPSWDRPMADDEKAFDEAWKKSFEDDPMGAMPQLLLNVRTGQADRHLVGLASLPDDPRIALRLAELAPVYGVSPERTQYWKSLWGIVAKTRDVRVCAPLRADFKDFTGTYYDHHRQGRRIVGQFVLSPEKSFDRWPLVLSVDEHADLAAATKAVEKLEAARFEPELELVRAIARDWTDDAPRLVYADWLGERGHPRGEMLVLACKKAGERTAAQDKRLEQLTRLPYLFGALTDLMPQLQRPELNRGLFHALRTDSWPGTLTWRACTGHPLLPLADSLEVADSLHPPLPADLARFLSHPAAARVAKVSLPKQDWTADLAAHLRGFKRVGAVLVRE